MFGELEKLILGLVAKVAPLGALGEDVLNYFLPKVAADAVAIITKAAPANLVPVLAQLLNAIAGGLVGTATLTPTSGAAAPTLAASRAAVPESPIPPVPGAGPTTKAGA